MNFENVVMKCFDNNEFVKEFNRLTNSQLKQSRGGVNKFIDDICGYNSNEEEMKKFIKFVDQHVWIPMLLNENNLESDNLL